MTGICPLCPGTWSYHDLTYHLVSEHGFAEPGSVMAEIEEGGCSMCGEPVPLPGAAGRELEKGYPHLRCSYCKRFLVRTMK